MNSAIGSALTYASTVAFFIVLVVSSVRVPVVGLLKMKWRNALEQAKEEHEQKWAGSHGNKFYQLIIYLYDHQIYKMNPSENSSKNRVPPPPPFAKKSLPPPLPKFSSHHQNSQSASKNNVQMTEKVANFLSEVGSSKNDARDQKDQSTVTQQSTPKKASQEPNLTEKAKKKPNLLLQSINSKLNNKLNSKKINLNSAVGSKVAQDSTKVTSNPDGALNLNESSSVDKTNTLVTQQRNSGYDIEYDLHKPNVYEDIKYKYLKRFEELDLSDEETNIPLIPNSQLTPEASLMTQKIIDPESKGPLNQFRGLESEMVDESEENKESQWEPESTEQLALRMMQKQGYKVGQGLGKRGQGITTPLTITKTTDSSCTIQQSQIGLSHLIRPEVAAKNALLAQGVDWFEETDVVVFVNLFSKVEEITEEVELEVKEELSRVGRLNKWLVYLMRGSGSEDGPIAHSQGTQLRIFAQMSSAQEAFGVFLMLNNRFYNESLASIRFYRKASFKGLQLDESVHPHVNT